MAIRWFEIAWLPAPNEAKCREGSGFDQHSVGWDTVSIAPIEPNLNPLDPWTIST